VAALGVVLEVVLGVAQLVVPETPGEVRVVLGVMLTRPKPYQKPTKPNRHQKSHKPSSNNHRPGVEAEAVLGAEVEAVLGEVREVVLGVDLSELALGVDLSELALGVDL